MPNKPQPCLLQTRHNRIRAQMPISAQNNSTTYNYRDLLLGWLPQQLTHGELTTMIHLWRAHHNSSPQRFTRGELTTTAHSWRTHHNNSLVESSPQQLSHGELTTTAHSWSSPQQLTPEELTTTAHSWRVLHNGSLL